MRKIPIKAVTGYSTVGFSAGHSDSPLIRPHPETGRLGVFGGSYVQGFDGVEAVAAEEFKDELREWLARPGFVYRHKWKKACWCSGTIVVSCTGATGGYEGYDRLLHRLTIADDAAYTAKHAAICSQVF